MCRGTCWERRLPGTQNLGTRNAANDIHDHYEVLLQQVFQRKLGERAENRRRGNGGYFQ